MSTRQRWLAALIGLAALVLVEAVSCVVDFVNDASGLVAKSLP
jgi:hypothetical protein